MRLTECLYLCVHICMYVHIVCKMGRKDNFCILSRGLWAKQKDFQEQWVGSAWMLYHQKAEMNFLFFLPALLAGVAPLDHWGFFNTDPARRWPQTGTRGRVVNCRVGEGTSSGTREQKTALQPEKGLVITASGERCREVPWGAKWVEGELAAAIAPRCCWMGSGAQLCPVKGCNGQSFLRQRHNLAWRLWAATVSWPILLSG